MSDPAPVPPRWRRVYAHIRDLDMACPLCGKMTIIGRGHAPNQAYDRRTARYTCPNCKRRWYVGVILWPTKGRRARPEDHTPTPGEAAEIRALYSCATDQRMPGYTQTDEPMRRRSQVNMRCSCGETCPVHNPGKGTEDDEDLDD